MKEEENGTPAPGWLRAQARELGDWEDEQVRATDAAGEIRNPDKQRPVLHLIRDSVLEYLREVTIAPVTTTIRDIPTEVLLSSEDGMPRACAINLDHVQTVSRDKLGAVITILPASRMEEGRSALLFALGFRTRRPLSWDRQHPLPAQLLASLGSLSPLRQHPHYKRQQIPELLGLLESVYEDAPGQAAAAGQLGVLRATWVPQKGYSRP